MTAYLEPEVDTSREPFSWAAPDLDSLRHLAAAKFGWGGQQTDNVLMPVIGRLKQKNVSDGGGGRGTGRDTVPRPGVWRRSH